eukprot:TRINITY_DN1546_c0_g1_i2.p1 TRINITY_DN1546_c0_g1~~TRINITY_DN1546_c0_g1_i2.p1  ORF type:complete len:443 (+),score=119.97 TRINITY_DN1546_c0_g1_i2:469-1797(+)
MPTGEYALAVYAVDDDGKPVTEVNCTVALNGPGGPIDVQVDDSGYGTFKVKYESENLPSGAYAFDVCVDGKQIKNSPKFYAEPQSDQNQRDTEEFSRESKEKKDHCAQENLRQLAGFMGFEGSPPLTAERYRQLFFALRSILRANDFVKVQTFRRGTEETLFCPRLSTSEQNPGARWCMALCGVGKEGPQTGLNQFAVYPVEANGRPGEEADFIVKIEGPNGPVEVDVESSDVDGSFNAKYNQASLSTGDYTAWIFLDGQLTKDSPVKFQVENIAEPKKCFVKGIGLEELTVYARGSNGMPADGICTIEMSGPNGPIEVKMVDDSNFGTFHAEYNPNNLPSGAYTIKAMIDSQPIKDSMVNFQVKTTADKKKANPEKSYAKYAFDEHGKPAAEYSLAVYTVDDDGEPVIGANCTVELNGPNGPIDVQLDDSDDSILQGQNYD